MGQPKSKILEFDAEQMQKHLATWADSWLYCMKHTGVQETLQRRLRNHRTLGTLSVATVNTIVFGSVERSLSYLPTALNGKNPYVNALACEAMNAAEACSNGDTGHATCLRGLVHACNGFERLYEDTTLMEQLHRVGREVFGFIEVAPETSLWLGSDQELASVEVSIDFSNFPGSADLYSTDGSGQVDHWTVHFQTWE